MSTPKERSPLDDLLNHTTPAEYVENFLRKYWFHSLFILLLVIVGGLYYRNNLIIDRIGNSLDRQAEQTTKTIERIDTFNEEQKQAMRASFKVGPLPPMPALGTAPKLPPIPEVRVLPNGQRNVEDRMRYLVQQNPINEVQVDMNRAVASNELTLNIQVGAGLVAAFSYMPRMLIASANKSLGNEAAFPMFSMDPETIDKIDSTEDALRAMLVVYHEWTHYKQWRDTPAERNYFLPKRTDVALSKLACEHVWEQEHQAYTAECQVGLSWGIVDSASELCRRSLDPVDFNTYLFIMLGNGPQGQNMQNCLPIWAKAAGAPNPEVFE